MASLVAEASGLGVTEEGYERYSQIANRVYFVTNNSRLEPWPAYRARLAEVEARIAIPLEANLVEFVLRRATLPDAYGEISEVRRILLRYPSFSSARDSAYGEQRARLEARLLELATVIAADERRTIDSIGAGISGLARGVAWQRAFDQYYGRFVGPATASQWGHEVLGVQRYFDEHRSVLLLATRSQLQRELHQASTLADVDSVLARYVTERERTAPAALPVMDDVKARKGAIRYLANKREVLGPGGVTATAGSPHPSRRAPTTSEMYDAVVPAFVGVSDTLKNYRERCPLTKSEKLTYVEGAECMYGYWFTVAGDDFRVTRFERRSCEKSKSADGYDCKFVFGFTGGMFPSALSGILTRGGVEWDWRFAFSEERGWTAYPPDDSR